MTHTAARATTPPAADSAFAAVIFDMDGVVTNTAGLHAAAAANVVGTKAYTWAEQGR